MPIVCHPTHHQPPQPSTRSGRRNSLAHLLGNIPVECEHPEAEDQLVLALEVDARAEHGQQCGHAVDAQKRVSVLVHPQQQLQTAGDRRDVLVVLRTGDSVRLQRGE